MPPPTFEFIWLWKYGEKKEKEKRKKEKWKKKATERKKRGAKNQQLRGTCFIGSSVEQSRGVPVLCGFDWQVELKGIQGKIEDLKKANQLKEQEALARKMELVEKIEICNKE